eukprot:TRINITY_DN10050_c0_g1_i2.p1 TRINITY_DN10050_c0_g1~~TRINITY_DN10050_c0_g1_i2.p1  ORF type:complete len:869 (+),score=186.05 TRINITY_DN10050_c0_g1_i2:143-2749(+)
MSFGVGAYAAAGAAASGGVAMGLFGYNRGNFMMDQKLHWARYNAGNNLAIAQTGMYREDIEDLTELTCARMDLYHGVAGMTATILTAIFCPGRVGLHTPPPPGWLMGLMMVNVGGTYIWLGLVMWLAMHASLRASCASTHLKTRFVRLPIPAQWMLDRSRKFLSSYEEQPLREVLRLPFFRHQRGKTGGHNEDMSMDADAMRRTRHGFDVPAWYRMEKEIDQTQPFESMMPLAAQGSAPEHFEVYRELQNEWWPYDVYSRISIFLAFLHLTHCWSFQHMGHQFAEVRGVFTAGVIAIPMFVLQQIILTLDIAPSNSDIPFQRLGPCSLIFAWIGLAIEYKRWYDPSEAVFGYVCTYLAYACHIVYTIQLLRICAPDFSKPPEQAEVPAGSWWPQAWALPSAFKHAIWLVAPPRNLEPGVNDLAGEMRDCAKDGDAQFAGKGRLTADPVEAKRRDVHRAMGKQGESPAWFNVKVGLSVLLISWIYLTFGFTIEIINQGTGHPSFLNAFGLPNNLRDPRYRPVKIGYEEPTEVGTGGAFHGPAKGIGPIKHHGHERRLAFEGSDIEVLKEVPRHEMAERIRTLLPQIQEFASGRIQLGAPSSPGAKSMCPMVKRLLPQQGPARAHMQWPALFQPRLLACGHAAAHAHGKVALALSHHGRGALIHTAASHIGAQEIPAETTPFALHGIAGHGALLAASWDEHGLMLAASTGSVLQCPGAGPTEGMWKCGLAFNAKLPISSSQPFKGAIALTRVPQTKEVRAAVAFHGESAVTVYSHTGHEHAAWLPAGEVRTRAQAVSAAFAAEAKELLLASVDGAVGRLHMGTGKMHPAAHPVSGYDKHEWQAACPIHNGGIARLAVEPNVQEPTLFLGA